MVDVREEQGECNTSAVLRAIQEHIKVCRMQSGECDVRLLFGFESAGAVCVAGRDVNGHREVFGQFLLR